MNQVTGVSEVRVIVTFDDATSADFKVIKTRGQCKEWMELGGLVYFTRKLIEAHKPAKKGFWRKKK